MYWSEGLNTLKAYQIPILNYTLTRKLKPLFVVSVSQGLSTLQKYFQIYFIIKIKSKSSEGRGLLCPWRSNGHLIDDYRIGARCSNLELKNIINSLCFKSLINKSGPLGPWGRGGGCEHTCSTPLPMDLLQLKIYNIMSPIFVTSKLV